MLRWVALLVLPAVASAGGAQRARRHLASPPVVVPQDGSALERAVAAIVNEPGVGRAHWGVSVVKLDGTRLMSLNDGQFFQPASNAKLFTTAAVMALLPQDARLTTRVLRTANTEGETKDLFLVGAGDANFSGRPIPYVPSPAGEVEKPRDELRYIDALADEIQAYGDTHIAGDIVGDDRLFPYDPYPADWAIDDAPWYYGAPITALMIADNAMTLQVQPGYRGSMPTATFLPALPYYTVQMHATTGAAGSGTELDIQRAMGSTTIRIYGHIAQDAVTYRQDISIDDPAMYAALALKAALEKRGIAVAGKAVAIHAPHAELAFDKSSHEALELPAAPRTRADAGANVQACAKTEQNAAAMTSCLLAEHTGTTLYDDVVVTNKVSENQHAELMLRLLGLNLAREGTTAQGARVVRSFLTGRVGVDAQDFVFYDGSGLSGHDLVTPRATTKLLTYAAAQPWGEQWKASFPVGGVDGSLRSRFSEPPLTGHVFAKTGTLGEARALSGYLDCASGQTVAFSVMVSAHSPATDDDRKAMDRIVAAIAAAE